VIDPSKRTMRGFGVTKDATQDKDARDALEALDSFSPPALAYARADANSITFAAPTTGGPFGITPSTLMGLPGGLGLSSVIEQGMSGKGE
jgi:hypothetical protein